MKNVMMKFKSLLVSLGMILVLCAFSSGYEWYDGGEFKTSLVADNEGYKEFMFTASDHIDLYLKNHSVIPILVYAQCHNTQEVIEQILLPQESTKTRPFILNGEPVLPVEWVFFMGSRAYDVSKGGRILVEFIAGWNGFYGNLY